MDSGAIQELVIAGYLEFEWNRWRHTMEDGETFFAVSWAEWEQMARAAIYEQELVYPQLRVIRQNITVDGFLGFASRLGLSLTSDSRSHYAAELAGELEVRPCSQ